MLNLEIVMGAGCYTKKIDQNWLTSAGRETMLRNIDYHTRRLSDTHISIRTYTFMLGQGQHPK